MIIAKTLGISVANIQLYQPFDMFALPVFDGFAQTAAEETIVIESGYDRLIFGGRFTIAGDEFSGTVHTVSLTLSNTPVLGASGFELPAGIASDLLRSDQPLATLERILGGNDLLQGSSGNEIVSGFAGDDTMSGGFGDDQLRGGLGNDLISGNPGDDLIQGNQGNDLLYGGQGNDALRGGKDQDILYGNLGVDALYGDLGDDVIYGGQGNDYLSGGEGNDTLFGGIHDDVLEGGRGADVYSFGRGAGNDAIIDLFLHEGDRIDLQGQSYSVSSSNGSALVSLEGGGTIILYGVAADAVNASFFG